MREDNAIGNLLKHGLDLNSAQLQVGIVGGGCVVQQLLKAIANRQPGLRVNLGQSAEHIAVHLRQAHTTSEAASRYYAPDSSPRMSIDGWQDTAVLMLNQHCYLKAVCNTV